MPGGSGGGLTGQAEWKEILTVTDEDGQSFTFYCGWGVEPPVAHIPSEADWRRTTPPWLHERRADVITLIESMGHVVADGPYRDWLR